MRRIGLVALAIPLLTIAAPADACPVQPSIGQAAEYTREMRRHTTVVVIGRLIAPRSAVAKHGVLTTQRVVLGERRKTYRIVGQSLMCTYAIPTVAQGKFYLGKAKNGFWLLAVDDVQ